MDRLERLFNESGLRALMARYAHLVDDGQVDECAQLFAPEGVFAMGPQELRGPAAIAAWS
ncbi:MAG: nuclear transport factor 2 family protein, partial [Steroidobacteraceae bacterium]